MAIERRFVLEAVHGMLDAVQSHGTPQDYYHINHASADQIAVLVQVISTWLKLRDVMVEDDVN